MALIKCAECGRDISDTARACPGCGAAPKRARGQSGSKVGPALVLLIGVTSLVWMCSSADAPSGAAKSPDAPDAGARGACGLFIEKYARDPGSVEHIDQHFWKVTAMQDGTWTVSASYRAKNARGALDLHSTVCVMRKTADGWSLERLVK